MEECETSIFPSHLLVKASSEKSIIEQISGSGMGASAGSVLLDLSHGCNTDIAVQTQVYGLLCSQPCEDCVNEWDKPKVKDGAACAFLIDESMLTRHVVKIDGHAELSVCGGDATNGAIFNVLLDLVLLGLLVKTGLEGDKRKGTRTVIGKNRVQTASMKKTLCFLWSTKLSKR